MATIKVTCQDCGNVDITDRDIQLRLCENTRQVSYSFRCPVCRLTSVHDVSPERQEGLVSALRSAGVTLQCWTLPRELDEAHTGPAFTVDDELDFHLLLSGVNVCEDIPGWNRFLR